MKKSVIGKVVVLSLASLLLLQVGCASLKKKKKSDKKKKGLISGPLKSLIEKKKK